jgi:hypothetical protein
MKGTYEGADDEGSSRLVVMFARGQDVKLLRGATVTCRNVYGDEVVTEITGSRGHREALAIRSLDSGARERTSGRIIPDLGLGNSCGVKLGEGLAGGGSGSRGGSRRGSSGIGGGSSGDGSTSRGSRGCRSTTTDGEEL